MSWKHLWIPVILISIWDFGATAVGIAHLFGAATIATWAFSSFAALAMTAYLYATRHFWSMDLPVRIVGIAMWLVCFTFDLYTTLVGHLAFALDSSGKRFLEADLQALLVRLPELSAYQLGLIVITALFVCFCTVAIGFRLTSSSKNRPAI